jgi:hypothetical protein
MADVATLMPPTADNTANKNGKVGILKSKVRQN